MNGCSDSEPHLHRTLKITPTPEPMWHMPTPQTTASSPPHPPRRAARHGRNDGEIGRNDERGGREGGERGTEGKGYLAAWIHGYMCYVESGDVGGGGGGGDPSRGRDREKRGGNGSSTPSTPPTNTHTISHLSSHRSSSSHTLQVSNTNRLITKTAIQKDINRHKDIDR
ncbi:hypothetical protein TREMEDRAFT_64415 [Tremella mesenterica DSM 1558]|uniref:uncharacterized protein n=1 Tax=Tremella mesenterica (strain ATCC 24925 / CBS 8224 / DSM 1558 / NBRC 9311 / NRRL Y-6157 / RJB 2259-6 / UBC 559-6) TaxID=578456 RepID=UPI0003F49725|nr:uncharacterized protein TREMEDRAFT_64415 [Tremella mesenterica DSM 1558]EIW67176.1 hypothetical protein TREMEDRAFT_64415 [Tremella mesenterica DSM 1558]